MQTRLRTQLLCTQERLQVLPANGQARLLVALICCQCARLIRVELLLGLLVGALQTGCLNVAHLCGQIALSFGILDGLTCTTKSTCSRKSSTALRGRDVGLALCFALLNTHDILHVRRHVCARCSGLGKGLGAHFLRWPHLVVAQVGVKLHARGVHLRGAHAVGRNALCRAHLVVTQVGVVLHARSVHLRCSNPVCCNALRWPHLVVAQERVVVHLRAAHRGGDVLPRIDLLRWAHLKAFQLGCGSHPCLVVCRVVRALTRSGSGKLCNLRSVVHLLGHTQLTGCVVRLLLQWSELRFARALVWPIRLKPLDDGHPLSVNAFGAVDACCALAKQILDIPLGVVGDCGLRLSNDLRFSHVVSLSGEVLICAAVCRYAVCASGLASGMLHPIHHGVQLACSRLG